ncbi:MAG: adenine phosphoribosyltransferase [Alphaproteobacteria bacterium]|nr:adenine phosphoribosyltransferase [Alphaproteobacteria bacterium]
MDFKQHIGQVPDFPKPGILFYDIATLLADAAAWRAAIDRMAEAIAPYKPDRLAGIESRGFLVAAPLALHLDVGFIMVRKHGKLPGATVSHEYALEYGSDILEIQKGAVSPGDRIVVLDDLLATGGTLAAAIELIERQAAKVVGAACIIELGFLEGRKRIGVPFSTLVTYDT